MTNISEILEVLPLGIHIIDPEGVTIYYNQACREIDNNLNGLPVVGLPVKKLVDEGILSKSIGLEVLEQKKLKESIQTVNGKQVYSQGIPLFDEKNILQMVVVTTMDIPYLMKMDSRLNNLKHYTELLLEQLKQYNVSNELNSSSKQMEFVKKMADKAAQYDSNVLITGESGVGKGVLFHYIHSHSVRKDKSTVTLNCAAIPETLFESELFGYEAGSFTGASKHGKKGLLDMAKDGTMFLDEVGDLSLSNQAKLLNVLQERKFIPVGGLKAKSCDVRIIAATNKDLPAMVKEGTFREDLFYRLNVFPIHIPPLRERREDIVSLTKFFLEKKNKTYGLSREISGDLLRMIYAMDWPGNARELENYVERLVLTSDSDLITIEDAGVFTATQSRSLKKENGTIYQELVEQFEIELLNTMLKEEKSIKVLSEKYSINESTLRKKLNRFKIPY